MKLLFSGIWILLALALLPPIYWALTTHFGLVDDFTSVTTLKWLRPGNDGFWQWCHLAFFDFPSPTGRYRPFLEIYNFLTFYVFGGSHGLHHALRLLIKAITAWLGLKILFLFRQRNLGSGSLASLVFLSTFLFFPNAPDARLCTQEPQMTLFFAWHAFVLLKLVLQAGTFRSRDWVTLIFSYFLLSWSKESAIFLMAPTIMVIFLVADARRAFYVSIPLLFITLNLGIRLLLLQHEGGYGTVKMTWDVLRDNVHPLANQIFLWNTSKILPFGLIVIAVTAALLSRRAREKGMFERSKAWSLSPEGIAYSYLISCFVLLVISFLTLWAPSLRYYFPASFFVALSAALGIQKIQKDMIRFSIVSQRNVRLGRMSVLVGCIIFAATNLYNLYYQYYIQAAIRGSEVRLEDYVLPLLQKGKLVRVSPIDERDIHFVRYYLYYLPTVAGVQPTGQGFPIALVPPSSDLSQVDYFVTKGNEVPAGFTIDQTFEIAPSELMEMVAPVSAFLQARSSPYVWGDYGATPAKWKVLRNLARS